MTAEFIVAVHALVYLNHNKTHKSSEEIAENVCTNPARVRKVMSKLKKAGLAEAKLSFEGGYAFVKEADSVTLYDIFRATDDSIVNVSWRSGSECAECPISRSMKPLMDNVIGQIDNSGREVLKKITIDDIDRKIFKREGQTHEI